MKLYIKSFLLFLVLVVHSLALCQQQQKILIKAATIKPIEFFEKYIAVGQCKSSWYCRYSIAITQGDNVQAGNILITIDKKLAEAHKTAAETAFYSSQLTYKRNLLLLEKKSLLKQHLIIQKLILNMLKQNLLKPLINIMI